MDFIFLMALLLLMLAWPVPALTAFVLMGLAALIPLKSMAVRDRARPCQGANRTRD
jgi:hypothetical protein